MSAASIVIDLLAKTGSFVTDMGKAEKSVKNFKSSTSELQSFIKGIGFAAVAASVTVWAKSMIDAGDALNDMSQRTGVSIENLASLETAANQNGTSLEGLAAGIQKLNLSLSQSRSSNEMASALERLGITSNDAMEALFQMADTVAQAGDSGQYLADVQKVLGKGYAELLPLLKAGRSELEASAFANREYAKAMADFAPKADKLKDDLAQLNTQWKFFSTTILNDVVPTISVLLKDMNTIAAKSGWLTALLYGLGGAIVYAFKGTEDNAALDKMRALEDQAKRLKDAMETVKKSKWMPETVKNMYLETYAKQLDDIKKKWGEVSKEYQYWAEKYGKLTPPKPSGAGGGNDLPSFGSLTQGLTIPSQQLKEYLDMKNQIVEAGKREGRTNQEVAEAVEALRKKYLGSTKEVKSRAEEIAAANKDLLAKTQQWVSQVEGPLEKYNRELAELTMLYDKGLMAADTYAEAVRKIGKEYYDTTEQGKKAKELQDSINTILSQTPTAQLERQREQIKALYELLAQGKIKYEEFAEAVDVALGRTKDANEKTVDEITEFWKQAARNMQDAMSNLFFDLMQGKMSDLVGSFKTMIDRMVANLLASQLLKFLIGDFGTTGQMGGKVGEIFGKIFSPPSYDVGTSFVPQDQLAYVHRGEAIIPASMNKSGAMGSVSVNNHFTINGTMDTRTQSQIAAQIGLSVNRAMKRNY